MGFDGFDIKIPWVGIGRALFGGITTANNMRNVIEQKRMLTFFENAQNGDSSAQYEVGKYLLKEARNSDEIENAFGWIAMSANAGNRAARSFLGQEAKNRNAVAQYNYGVILLLEATEERDYDKLEVGKRWVELSAEKGYKPAIEYMEDVFREEDEEDEEETLSPELEELLSKAENGDAESQCILGVMCIQSEDFKMGIYWLEKSAKQGCQEAIASLNILKENDMY